MIRVTSFSSTPTSGRNTTELVTLNRVCEMAMWSITVFWVTATGATAFTRGTYTPAYTSGSMTITPSTLNRVWAMAARRPEGLVRRAAICAVTVVPMLSPRMNGIDTARATSQSVPIAPLAASTWIMAMDAELLCSSIVRHVPASTARTG